jgi:hypothetical protein
MQLCGWGRHPRHESKVVAATTPSAVPLLQRGIDGLIARGNGRAYGDAAIGLRATLSMGMLDRMLAFDPGSGLLTVEAGHLRAARIFSARCPGYEVRQGQRHDRGGRARQESSLRWRFGQTCRETNADSSGPTDDHMLAFGKCRAVRRDDRRDGAHRDHSRKRFFGLGAGSGWMRCRTEVASDLTGAINCPSPTRPIGEKK